MGTLHWIDLAIVALYLVILSGIGFLYSKRQANLEQFFLAGRRMGWLPIGLSLMACLNSGIDYLMQPSAVMKYGLVMVISVFSWLLLWPWVTRVTLPFYRRLNLYTAYEYLEQRFSVKVRTLAASIFLLWRLGWIATAMYVPCLAISAASGGSLPLVPTIVVLGSVVILYTVLGGIKAVIWTDVVQFFVMFGGLAATVWIVLSHVPGGVSEVWAAASSAGKTSIVFALPASGGAGLLEKIKLFFTTDMTALGFFIAIMVGRMAVYTGDQVMVQRFQTTKSLRDSRQAFVINAVGDAVWMIGLAFVGLVLFAYVKTDPSYAGLASDEIFPTFLANRFPTGMVGLVIAAIFAASLGAIGSAINSCSSVVMVDFYNHLIRKDDVTRKQTTEDEQKRQVLISRWTTLLVGVVAIVLSANVGRLGDLIVIANKVIQLFTGPLFAVYVLGMFTRRAGSAGVLAGGLAGAGVSAYVAFWSPLAFVWPAVLGFACALVCGYCVSLLLTPPTKEQSALCFRSVTKSEAANR